MPLKKIKRKDVENSTLKESDKWLYKKLLERLDACDDNPEKAFAEPIYKNDKKTDKNGNKLSPVSTIKVYSTKPDDSGKYINNQRSFVDNGSMVRVDVYMKNIDGREYPFFVPIYTHSVKHSTRKIRPTLKGLSEIDETFKYICGLYPNDYIKIKFEDEGKNVEGYYIQYGSSNAAIDLLPMHASGKDQRITCSARLAIKIERYDISILGDNYRWL